jgi:hypothetical protein
MPRSAVLDDAVSCSHLLVDGSDLQGWQPLPYYRVDDTDPLLCEVQLTVILLDASLEQRASSCQHSELLSMNPLTRSIPFAACPTGSAPHVDQDT